MRVASTTIIIEKTTSIKGHSIYPIKILLILLILGAIGVNIWGIVECSHDDKCNIDSCNKNTNIANDKSLSDWLSIIALSISLIGLLCTLGILIVPKLNNINLIHLISITTLAIGFGGTLICLIYCAGGECDTTSVST